MSKKDTERYYLFPGQGGRARRQKIKGMLLWGFFGGLLTAVAVGLTMYLVNHLTNHMH